jgi:hypothetical protein
MMAKLMDDPQDMEYLVENGEVGDCVRACTASILGLNASEVPHFVGEHSGNWRSHWEDWLEARGLIVVEIDPRRRPDCLYLGCGPTVRTKEYRPAAHMVVMEGIGVAHDPHPSRAGLTTLDRVYVLVPKSPAGRLALQEEGR